MNGPNSFATLRIGAERPLTRRLQSCRPCHANRRESIPRRLKTRMKKTTGQHGRPVQRAAAAAPTPPGCLPLCCRRPDRPQRRALACQRRLSQTRMTMRGITCSARASVPSAARLASSLANRSTLGSAHGLMDPPHVDLAVAMHRRRARALTTLTTSTTTSSTAASPRRSARQSLAASVCAGCRPTSATVATRLTTMTTTATTAAAAAAGSPLQAGEFWGQ